MTKVLKTLDLDLKDIPKSKQKEAKRDVLEYLENEISRNVSKGVSPVKGERNFKSLSGPYAQGEKQGNSTPNLQLEGDLLDSLEFNNKRGSKISVGYSADNPEVEKADGHNQHSAKAKKDFWGEGKNKRKALPKRRYIPEKDQSFKPNIEKGIDRILDKFREDPEEKRREKQRRERRQEEQTIISTETTPERTQVDVAGQVFNDETIIELIRRELERSGLE